MVGIWPIGFTSLYREGFAVVLFLESYPLKLGGRIVLHGVLLGLLMSGIVAVLTFIAHRRLPYRRMLVLTGVRLGAVLLVMVGKPRKCNWRTGCRRPSCRDWPP
jgi:high-affinity iron transporter